MCQDHVVSSIYMTAFMLALLVYTLKSWFHMPLFFGLPKDDDLSPKHVGEFLFMDDL